MPDLSLNLIASDLASSAIKGVAGSIRALGAEALKAAMEQEKADRQLQRVAGDLTETFKKQASALQDTLGVSDDMVQKLQTLSLSFGAAPSQVDATTRAILDFAAFTGKDATQAMEMLLRGVDNGGDALKKMGITYAATGDRTKDLALATAALTKKFGGAAATEGDSLAGSAARLDASFGEMKESFGGLITEFLNKTKVVDAVAEALNGVRLAMFGDDDEYTQRLRVRRALVIELSDLEKQLAIGVAATDVQGSVGLDVLKARALEIPKLIADLDAKIAGAGKLGDKPLNGVDPRTLAAQKAARDAAAAAEDNRKTTKDLWAEINEEADRQKLVEEKNLKESNEAKKAAAAEGADAQAQAHLAARLAEAAQNEALEKAEQAHWEQIGREISKGVKDAREKTAAAFAKEQQEKEFAAAGDAIGVAFVNAFATQLNSLAEGGEFDIASFFGDLLNTIGGIAGSIIGVINPIAGAAVGAGLGLLGGVVKRAGGKNRKRHDGGWSDADEFHAGGWPGLSTEEIPAVLQAGERVLSRQEVGRMGGRSGVDAAARGGGGGGGVTMVFNSLDSKGVRESFEKEAGSGFRQSILTGRGQVARIFGPKLVF